MDRTDGYRSLYLDSNRERPPGPPGMSIMGGQEGLNNSPSQEGLRGRVTHHHRHSRHHRGWSGRQKFGAKDHRKIVFDQEKLQPQGGHLDAWYDKFTAGNSCWYVARVTWKEFFVYTVWGLAMCWFHE